MSDKYDKIDRFLRNNLDDTDYAEYSAALDSLAAHAGAAAEPNEEQIIRAAYQHLRTWDQDTIRFARAVLALTSATAEPPKGFVLVPAEPTDAMTWAGQQARHPATNSITVIYKAMLAAAPAETPPAAGAIDARGQEDAWPKLDKPAQVDCSFGVGVSTRLVVEAAQRRYERESANRVKTLADALNDPRPLHEQIAEIRRQERPTAEVLNTMVGASPPEAPAAAGAALAVADAQIIELRNTKAYAPGVFGYIDFARDVLALAATPAPEPLKQIDHDYIVGLIHRNCERRGLAHRVESILKAAQPIERKDGK